MSYLEKEYHPVIEDYITDYVDENLSSVERETFEEVLVHDDDLRELAFSAKEGKKLLEQYRLLKMKK
ncbi:hypothetical protein [Gracilimonas mengyeensis]|uniref:Uncharacterized protein n=1 Tax=Gracilimonas mengyeensis TaxID=1302730 RepID=A0A521AMI8_9BACT|nr:hypothetical protein [Gracilimonas mengyeensis]SMO36038.1 hypothetical protein SAMN06265219_101240 [Gracilimonas mengyeensis]